MELYKSLRQRAMESATLLWSLDEVPENPKENIPAGGIGTFNLPVDREKQLADDLAFIASSEDDSKRIVAVCMEEQSNNGGVVIRVASNVGDVENTARNLQRVADSMSEASHRGKLCMHSSGTTTKIDPDVSSKLVVESMFEQIVTMCRKRILSRMRSTHAARTRKTSGKRSLPPLLLETVQQCSQYAISGTARATTSRVTAQSKRFNDAFVRLEDHADPEKVTASLLSLLKQAHIFDIAELQSTTALSPRLNPSLKQYLPVAVCKLARYRQVAINLTNAARTTKYRVFHTIVVTPVRCNQINTRTLTDRLRNFDAALSQLAISGGKTLPTTRKKAGRRKYEDRMLKDTTAWKVHAEVQILLYYELNAQSRRPRVICASKSACYLCDLFFRVHGGFDVPRSHGRIYDKWTLPDWKPEDMGILHALNPVLTLFNRALENKIMKVLAEKTKRRSPPNESVVALYEPWSSRSTIKPDLSPAAKPMKRTRSASSLLCEPSASHARAETRKDESKPASASAEDSMTQQQDLESHVSSTSTGESASGSCSVLSPHGRQPIRRRIELGTSIIVRMGSFRVHFSMAENGEGADDMQFDRWESFVVNIEGKRDTDRTSNSPSMSHAVDLDALEPGRDVVLPIGPARRSNRLHCRTREQQFIVSFNLPP